MRHALARFLNDTRGGATAIAAVGATIITVLSTAFIAEHNWMVSYRDALKSAANAANIAATQQLRSFPTSMSDYAVEAGLMSIAERYVRLNMWEIHRANPDAIDTIAITLDADRQAETVNISVTAPYEAQLFDFFAGFSPETITVASGAEAGRTEAWAVLAIDVSRSMSDALDSKVADDPADSKMSIVQEAALVFVDQIHTDSNGLARIGVAPWADIAWSGLVPTTSRTQIEVAIGNLNPVGSGTASSRGMQQAIEMLAQSPAGTQRAIVLLTDGEDNVNIAGGRCASRATCAQFRSEQCALAKDAGIEVFTIGAMRNTISRLADQLTQCATTPDHAFINSAHAQEMRETFSHIAGSLKPLRRVY